MKALSTGEKEKIKCYENGNLLIQSKQRKVIKPNW